MASSLIARLNELSAQTPDQIVQMIGDPLGKWVKARTLPRVVLEQLYSENPTVYLFEEGERPSGWSRESYYPFNRWPVERWATGWIGDEYYVRSREAHDADPNTFPTENV